MPQINLRVDAQFEKDLFAVMDAMRIASKSQAIRFAMHEVAEAFRSSAARLGEMPRGAAALNAGSGACR